MELLAAILLIFIFIGLSTARNKKGPSVSGNLSNDSQKRVIVSSQNQAPSPVREEQFKLQSEVVGGTKSSPITPSPNLASGMSQDDFCNKCGKSWRRWDNTENGGYWYQCSAWPSCDNTRDKQRRDKSCVNGHLRTPLNTAYTSAGHRRCLTCNPGTSKKFVGAQQPKKESDGQVSGATRRNRAIDSDKYCRNGHRRTEENTYVRPDGERECRVCRRNARK
jgi:ssDNA-binding Zn-finger/Zn-ribbon topoisomerase 1